MWSMWDAPSDRDYLEQFNPPEPEEDPDNQLQPEPEPFPLPEGECPF